MADSDKGLLTTIAGYAQSNMTQRFTGLLYSYLKPKLLTPELMGVWSLLAVVITYASYSHLGSRSALRYLIPKLESEGKTDEICRAKGTVYRGSFFLSLAVALGVAMVALFGDFRFDMRVGLGVVAVLILVTWGYEYYLAVLKSHQQFSVINGANYLRSAVQLLVGVTLIWFFSIYGLFATAIITMGSALVYFHFKYKDERASVFDRPLFIGLVADGYSILLYNAILALLTSIDRLVISATLGIEQLGYYSIALMASSIIISLLGSVRDVIEPKMAQAVAQKRVNAALYRYLLTPLYNTALYYPILIAASYFLVPHLIEILLPRYAEGIVPTQILVCGGGFLALMYCLRGVIVINQWQLPAVFILTSALVINLALNLTLVHFGYGVIGVSIGTGVTYFLMFLAIYLFIASRYSGIRLRLIRHLPQLLSPFIFCYTLIAGLSFTVGVMMPGFMGAMLNTIIATICLLGYSAIVARHNRLAHSFVLNRLRKIYGR